MPYINSKDGRREALRNGDPALTAGELNYQIFYYVKHNLCAFLEQYYDNKTYFGAIERIENFVKQFLGHNPNYQKYNDMTGALIRCEKEIVRRLQLQVHELTVIMDKYDDEIARYEDKKIIENGDVE